MYKEIEIATNDGYKKFGFLATGTTSTRYRMCFGRDLMIDLLRIQLNKIEEADTTAGARLAYIMNAQAEKKDLSKLNEDSFLEWADQFDGAALDNHMGDFVSMYFNSRKTTSTPKKEDGRQTEK